MREVEFDKNLTNLLNNKFPRRSPSKSSKNEEKEELEEELKLSFEEPDEIDANYEFEDDHQAKNKLADEFVPVDEIQTENGRHISTCPDFKLISFLIQCLSNRLAFLTYL